MPFPLMFSANKGLARHIAVESLVGKLHLEQSDGLSNQPCQVAI